MVVDDDDYYKPHTNIAWVNNGYLYTPLWIRTEQHVTFLSLVLGFSCLVLFHSFLRNGRLYPRVRIYTDLAALSGILFAICELVQSGYTDPIVYAVLTNLMAEGIFSVIISVCDCYMFWNRLKHFRKPYKFEEIINFMFIWLIIIWPWFALNSFMPLIWNVSSHEDPTYELSLHISTYGNIGYYAFITFLMFAYIVPPILKSRKWMSAVADANSPEINRGGNEKHRHSAAQTAVEKQTHVLIVFFFKTLIHFFCSCFSCLMWIHYPSQAEPLSHLVTIMGMHISFNTATIDYLCVVIFRLKTLKGARAKRRWPGAAIICRCMWRWPCVAMICRGCAMIILSCALAIFQVCGLIEEDGLSQPGQEFCVGPVAQR